eukprot:TRINITY_DN3638_c0_g1_i4.p1 TRINITY_DN3638_c0_g1~~TRINITY_DN3638_c0_g1_i4.p1  ORF type:complete len:129 (-),score=25.23 TRINITY_DN3638_c0_g1_i4:16-402(-)
MPGHGCFSGWTALHTACYSGYSECVSLLLQYGARTDIKDGDEKTCLYWATQEQEYVCVDLIHSHLQKVPEGEAQIEYARQQTNTRLSLRYLCVCRSALLVGLGDTRFASEMGTRLPAHLLEEVKAFSC